MSSDERTPAYDDLPTIEATGDGHAWDVWGRDDQLGSINRLTPERVAAAARLVRSGQVINLDLPLDEPNPPLGARGGYEHHIEVNRGGRDDSLDGFFLQGSSQWDGLAHIRHREFGYWGGRQDEDIDRGENGIERWAKHGIVGRGVLIDVKRHLDEAGTPLAPDVRFAIDGPLIEGVAATQGVELQQGDILLLRTGWLAWLRSLDSKARDALRGTVHPREDGLQSPGLDPSKETARWLWDHGVAAIAADNHALEALQIRRDEGFGHRRLLALLGLAIGEYLDLEELSTACAEDGVYEFMLVASPLNLPGGVGSPANAYAIK